jgi:arylsulfatase A-like enzyme
MAGLNLSPYQKRVLLETRMVGGHRLYDDLIKVPLIFSGVNIPSNKKITQQVRHVDIFPTIEDVISLPKKNDIDGESLLPLINGKKIRENLAYIESPPAVKEEHIKEKIIGVRTSSYKMLKQENSGNVVELYDLVNDPLEEENIVSSHPELVKEMESKLEKIISSKKITTTENKVDLTKIESELEKLGYN